VFTGDDLEVLALVCLEKFEQPSPTIDARAVFTDDSLTYETVGRRSGGMHTRDRLDVWKLRLDAMTRCGVF
jgi:hypothetical protein